MGIIHGAASRGKQSLGAQLIWRRAFGREGFSLSHIVTCQFRSPPFCGENSMKTQKVAPLADPTQSKPMNASEYLYCCILTED